jgi:TldD protein
MDFELQELADRAIAYSLDLGAKYCDARAEVQTRESALIENKEIEHIRKRKDKGMGIRLLKNGYWRFCSIANPISFEYIKDQIDGALKNLSHLEESKKTPIELYPITTNNMKMRFPVKKESSIEDLIRIGLECDGIISDKKRIVKSTVNPWFSETSKYFTSSEGSKILQIYTDTIMDMTATSSESGTTQSVNTTEGGRGGIEMLIQSSVVQNSASRISDTASQLIDAISVKEEKSTVVMNPDFVALLTHEILGHPSEADRVLGKEMAWAGGAWWKGKINEKIGSEHLSVFDDPTIKHSLGWYYFDDEGVKTSRTTLMEDGILTSHMQNRETAHVYDTAPTGNMRATSYMFMPLIRMACTCIGKGDWSQEEMIKDVKRGYMISDMKIPSIDMRRYNWSISCQYAQKIENGELTDMLRDVIIVGTAPEFFKSIDACGKDFSVRPITNCGKGDPMQSMMMGNGGPSIRGVATVRSAG